MKHLKIFLLLSLFYSCQTNENGDSSVLSNTSKDKRTSDSQNFKEGTDYQVFERMRVMDNEGFSQPIEASSILLPKGWTLQGGMKWIRPGQPCEGTTIAFKATSGDGKYTLEFMPGVLWSRSDDPQMAMMSGQFSVEGCFREVAIPSSAEDYLRSGFANSIGNPSIAKVQANKEVVSAMRENDQKTYNELMSNGASDLRINHDAITAHLNWGNGRAGIALIGFTKGYIAMPNRYTGGYFAMHSGNASNRILFTFPEEEKEKAEQIFATAITSIRTNPEWKKITENFWKSYREKSRQITADRVAMLDQQTREIANRAIANGNQRLNQLDNQIRSWESKPNSNDRSTTNFIKAIREVENFTDATGTVEVPSGYNQVWNSNNGSGTYIMSNNPNFDPGSTFQDQRWQEMKRVE